MLYFILYCNCIITFRLFYTTESAQPSPDVESVIEIRMKSVTSLDRYFSVLVRRLSDQSDFPVESIPRRLHISHRPRPLHVRSILVRFSPNAETEKGNKMYSTYSHVLFNGWHNSLPKNVLKSYANFYSDIDKFPSIILSLYEYKYCASLRIL